MWQKIELCRHWCCWVRCFTGGKDDHVLSTSNFVSLSVLQGRSQWQITRHARWNIPGARRIDQDAGRLHSDTAVSTEHLWSPQQNPEELLPYQWQPWLRKAHVAQAERCSQFCTSQNKQIKSQVWQFCSVHWVLSLTKHYPKDLGRLDVTQGGELLHSFRTAKVKGVCKLGLWLMGECWIPHQHAALENWTQCLGKKSILCFLIWSLGNTDLESCSFLH